MKNISTVRFIIVVGAILIVALLLSQMINININTTTTISPGNDAQGEASARLIDKVGQLIDDLRTGAAVNKLFGEWLPGLLPWIALFVGMVIGWKLLSAATRTQQH